MSRLRVVLAVVALAAAIVAALLASDLRSVSGAIGDGDTQFAQEPGLATWRPSTVLPFHVASNILNVSDQLAFRRASKSFVYVRALGNGFDNGYSESRERSNLEVKLLPLSHGPNHARDADIDNMLGILAYADSNTSGSTQPAPITRAVSDFQAAVELDPSNADAKYNLEWLQRNLAATGSRAGNSVSQGGGVVGHQGGGGGVPGRGY